MLLMFMILIQSKTNSIHFLELALTMTETENRILEAAEQEFFELGYDGARTARIAEKAGVTHAMLHYYFRSKENLFMTIMQREAGNIRKVLMITLDNPTLTFKERIRLMVEQHFDFVRERPQLPYFIINEMHRSPERMHGFLISLGNAAKDVTAPLQCAIDRAAAQGECRPMNAIMLMMDMLSMNLFSFIMHPMLDNILKYWDISSKEITDQRREECVRTIQSRLGLY